MVDAVGLLQDIQWSATGPAGQAGQARCPVCHAAEPSGHTGDCRLAAVLAASPRWRHRKRGTTYREVGRATLQHSGGVLDDQDAMVVYRSEADGALGVRALIEFSDGRFERL